MKITNTDRRVVESSTWMRSRSFILRREKAISNAPTAPIAPPSVGVAIARKMVPSTRKISASGGIITKVTRSAMRDSRPRPNRRLSSAMTTDSIRPNSIDTTTTSSPPGGITVLPYLSLSSG